MSKKLSICQRNKDKGSKVWYLRVFNTDTHRINYKSLNTTVKYKAEQILEKEKQKIYLNPDEEKLENLPTLKTLYNIWINFVESNYTHGTALNYKSKLRDFFKYCESNNITTFTSFTAIHANNMINQMQLSNNTKRNKKMVFLTFFNWILETYDINTKNVFSKVKTPKVQRPIRSFWTLEQIKMILENTASKPARLCFAFMAFCGLRISEALNLKWENIKENSIEIVNGKGGKNAVLPLAQSIKDEIKRYIEQAHPLIQPEKKVVEMCKDYIDRELKKVCQKMGIEGFNHLHKFRHSFASNLLRNGANIIAVSKLMRHASPSMTLNIYSHILPDDLDQTLKLLDNTKATATSQQGGGQ